MDKMIACANCGKETPHNSTSQRRNKTGVFYCSYECQRDHRRKQKQYSICPICGRSFYAKPYMKRRLKVNEQLTCSPECRRAALGWESKLLYCDWCGEGFRRRNALINGHNFCSRECMGNWQSANVKGESSPSWQGGYQPYYGADWKTNRRAAKKRDNRTCQACGSHQSGLSHTLEVHHIKPVRLFDNPNDANELSNLVTLCRPCHVKADVLARWFFNSKRRQSQPRHPLQDDSAIARFYF